ncbi:transposable element Tcb1 transposase [Trichonephila clavipes]|nr:transposable element Tcb1 transposase [Trichonephila clavipes]
MEPCSTPAWMTRQLGRSDCVGTSGSERCHLHEDQAQDALDRPDIEKTTTSLEMHAYSFICHYPGTGSGRPLRLLSLTPTYRRLRLEWCHARGNWTAAEWNQVVFSDESRFNLSSDDNRVRVWRPRGERLNPAFLLYSDTRLPQLDHLGQRVGHPTSLNELEARLKQMWNEMSQDIIPNLYASMPDCIVSCIRARGGSTEY